MASEAPSPLDLLTDEELVSRAARGSGLAWRVIVTRYYPAMVRHARLGGALEADAEEIASEALMKAFAGRGLFDPSRPFAPWVASVTSNALRDHQRRRRGHDAVLLYEHQREPDWWVHTVERAERVMAEPISSDAAETREFEDDTLDLALASLTPSDRNLLREWVYDTAGATGPRTNAERAALHRARRRLSAAYHARHTEGVPHRGAGEGETPEGSTIPVANIPVATIPVATIPGATVPAAAVPGAAALGGPVPVAPTLSTRSIAPTGPAVPAAAMKPPVLAPVLGDPRKRVGATPPARRR